MFPPSIDTGSVPDFELRVKIIVLSDCSFSKTPRLGIIGLYTGAQQHIMLQVCCTTAQMGSKSSTFDFFDAPKPSLILTNPRIPALEEVVSIEQ